MTEQQPIRCKKDTCQIVVKDALFRGYFARCETCGKSAGTVVPGSPDEAIAEWNRWVEIGGFIVTAKTEWPGEAHEWQA